MSPDVEAHIRFRCRIGRKVQAYRCLLSCPCPRIHYVEPIAFVSRAAAIQNHVVYNAHVDFGLKAMKRASFQRQRPRPKALVRDARRHAELGRAESELRPIVRRRASGKRVEDARHRLLWFTGTYGIVENSIKDIRYIPGISLGI